MIQSTIKIGRPRKDIEEKLFDQLIQLPLIKSDIAHAFGCSEDTIENYVKARFQTTFSELQAEKRQLFRKNILGKQYELAMKGNVALLIWLGKQYLGQSDKIEQKQDINIAKPMSSQEALEVIKSDPFFPKDDVKKIEELK